MATRWQEERQKFIDGTAVRSVTIELLQETHDRVLELAKQREWTEEEAFRLVLLDGLAFAAGDLVLRRAELAGAEQAAEELKQTTRQMMEESTHAAAMKFQAYRLSQDNQVLEMHEGALKNTVLMQLNRMKIFREDEEHLKARLAQLEAENQRLRTLLPDADAQLTTPAHKRSRLLGFMHR